MLTTGCGGEATSLFVIFERNAVGNGILAGSGAYTHTQTKKNEKI